MFDVQVIGCAFTCIAVEEISDQREQSEPATQHEREPEQRNHGKPPGRQGGAAVEWGYCKITGFRRGRHENARRTQYLIGMENDMHTSRPGSSGDDDATAATGRSTLRVEAGALTAL